MQRDGREARDADQDADAADGPEGGAVEGAAGSPARDGRPPVAGAGQLLAHSVPEAARREAQGTRRGRELDRRQGQADLGGRRRGGVRSGVCPEGRHGRPAGSNERQRLVGGESRLQSE